MRPVKWGMTLRVHSQTSTVQPLKFGNGVISSHKTHTVVVFSMVGLKLIHEMYPWPETLWFLCTVWVSVITAKIVSASETTPDVVGDNLHSFDRHNSENIEHYVTQDPQIDQ